MSGSINLLKGLACSKPDVRTPVFDKAMRAMLLDAARHDWSGVSPAIFGSLFQSVMSPKERRAKGAHYTSEDNILKVIGPLFLDDLHAELARLTLRKTGRNPALIEFQHKLARLTFFDPACGCGNFLVVAYRELRRLELACLKALYGDQMTDVSLLSRVTVDQFYGIEFEEFPARIAEVAMWMTDHLANNELNEAFRLNYARIPLKDTAHIRHGDALEVDWADVIAPARCSYIMGNPPFVGAKFQSELQRAQVRRIAGLGGSGGTLDYVAAWFLKAGAFVNGNPSPLAGEGARRAGEGTVASEQMDTLEANPSPRSALLSRPLPQGERGGNKRIRIAFVSTNSITQGEQVAQLWPILFDRYHLEIAFAHRTFSWGSEARGRAHVHVVIIGLTHADNEPDEKRLFSYPDIKGLSVESRHSALTAYLFDARGVANRHLVVKEEARPINGAPKLAIGSQIIDDGHFTFLPAEKAAFVAREPKSVPYFRQLIGADEYINGTVRWVLTLHDAEPSVLNSSALIKERIAAVRTFRLASKRKSTLAAARQPNSFALQTIPANSFLVLPRVSSERREYVPFGWQDPPAVPTDAVIVLMDAAFWQFAILTSRAHMAWLGHMGGRLKSDFRYSIGLVYNTFPWPDASPAQRSKIETLAQAILDARAAHPTSSLADLYDPDTMPADLRRAHTALDTAVDKLYRPAPFASDRDRVEHLFGRYEALVNPLERIGIAKNKRVARKAG
jgi:N-6 DNA Methylase